MPSVITTHLNPDNPVYKIARIVQPHFGFDIASRMSSLADVNHFKWKEDKSVWLQARGKIPHIYEIYWDGEHITDMTEHDTDDVILVKFLRGFKQAYESGKIRLMPDRERRMYDELAKNQKSEEDIQLEEANKLSERTQEDKIQKAVITSLIKDKKAEKEKQKRKNQLKL